MNEILKAIGAAKLNFPPILKDAKNPHFKNTYATLGAILGAVENPLITQSVVIVHEQVPQDNGWLLKTSLIHWESNQAISTVFPVSGSDPQKLGSALTYARRYNLLNLLNLSTEDDDGNAASVPQISEAQREVIKKALDASQVSGADFGAWLQATYKVKKVTDLPQSELQPIMAAITSGKITPTPTHE